MNKKSNLLEKERRFDGKNISQKQIYCSYFLILLPISMSSLLTAFLGNFFTCLFGGIGLGGAGPFFFFHCPSILDLSGLSGVSLTCNLKVTF